MGRQTNLHSIAATSVVVLMMTCVGPVMRAADQTAPNTDDGASVNSSPREGLARWVSLDQFDFSSRFRSSVATNGNHSFEGGQERDLISGKFKFDQDGRYFVGFRASSGRYFNWAYSTFAGPNFSQKEGPFLVVPAAGGIIYGDIVRGVQSVVPQARGWDFYVRELYLSATPVKYLTAEFGGLGIERGEASEITTYDEDGYLSGERIRIRDREHLFVDEISATFAYLGISDLNTPNFFARGTDLSRNNYRQVAVDKRFGKRLAVSGQYDWLAGFKTVREAGRLNVSESKILDGARVELYQRLNSGIVDLDRFPGGNGWSVSGSKNLFSKRLHIEGGYANIDRYDSVYGQTEPGVWAGFSLNGDAYQIGERVFARASYTPHPFVTFFGFYTHELNPERDPIYNSFNRQNIQGGMTINFKAMLVRAGLF